MMESLAASRFPHFPRQLQYRIISIELEIFSYHMEKPSGEKVGKPTERQPHMEGNMTLPGKTSARSRCWLLHKGRADNSAFVLDGLLTVLRWLTAFLGVKKVWWLGMSWTLSHKNLPDVFVQLWFQKSFVSHERRVSPFQKLGRWDNGLLNVPPTLVPQASFIHVTCPS